MLAAEYPCSARSSERPSAAVAWILSVVCRSCAPLIRNNLAHAWMHLSFDAAVLHTVGYTPDHSKQDHSRSFPILCVASQEFLVSGHLAVLRAAGRHFRGRTTGKFIPTDLSHCDETNKTTNRHKTIDPVDPSCAPRRYMELPRCARRSSCTQPHFNGLRKNRIT